MGFFSTIGNIFCAIGRGIVAIFKGIFGGIAKIFSGEWTVIDSDTYVPITNKDKIQNDSRGRTPLDTAPVPACADYESYGYGYTSDVDYRNAMFLQNLYCINPEVMTNPKYRNYDIYNDPFHGYGVTYGPMFNPELSNRRFDMFGRRYDDRPIYDASIRNNHPPMSNLNPFSDYKEPVFSNYSQQYDDAYNYYQKAIDVTPQSDMGRAYNELLVDKEREMWSDDYIEDLDKYIWEDNHGYSRTTTPEIEFDIDRRRKELEEGECSTYVPENYVGNVI